MSLKIVLGRSGSGKSTYLLSDMANTENALYIVPEQFTFSAEKKIIDKFEVAGLGNPQALSFMRLADVVFAKYGSPEFVSDNASFEMLVSYCANSIKPDKLRLFDGLVKKSELAKTASSIITTFKRYSISPDKLKYAMESTTDELLKKKLSDAYTVYAGYSTHLSEAGIADKNDTLSVLANILADADCDYLTGKDIYIDQFSDFDPSEYECIKIMLKRADNVTVALCCDDEKQFATVTHTYNKLIHIAKKEKVQLTDEIKFSNSMLDSAPMLKHLEKFYFSDSTSPFCGTDSSIEFFCGQTKVSEIHNVGREIVSLVRDKGMRYRDISVIARDAEQYKSIVERIFPIYDIPVFVDRKLPLSGHSITLLVMGLLDIAVSGFTYENIFNYIKSPFSPLTFDEADELENYCLATGIRPYSWGKPFVSRYGAYNPENGSTAGRLTEEKLIYINTLREKVYTPLSKLIENLKKKSTVKELSLYLFDFFTEIKLKEKIRKSAIELEENGENLYALQTVQVYNVLIEIFNDICNVLGEKILTLKEFRTTVFAGLQSVEIGTIPSSNDCVTVGSIDRIKGHGAKVVFLVGTNSGVFPLAPTESGLFSDEDKKALEKLGIEMPPTLSEQAQNEQLLVYDALTCANEKLYISYPLSDNGKNALMPSEIVERVRTIFPDAYFTDDLFNLPDTRKYITTKKAVFDLVAAKLNDYINHGKILTKEESAAAYYFENSQEYSHLFKTAMNMTIFTSSATPVSPYLIKKAIGENMKTSITRLETYNKCPFSYFAKYILKLEPKQIFELNSSDSGSFLHDFLDKLSNLISASTDENGNPLTWKTIDDDFIKINTPKVLSEILSGVNENMLRMPRIKALFERLCRSAENAARSVKRHISKGDFIPMGYEISFDENGKFKPTKIILDDGATIVLRGRIDRADELLFNNGKFVRIVDYKSSEKTLSLSDVYKGVQLQLFVYLSNLCENGYQPAGILYCNLSDPIVDIAPGTNEDEIIKKRYDELRMNGIVLSEEGMLEHMGGKDILKSGKTATAKDFNNMFRHLKKTIKKTAESIYNGLFPIKCNDDACKWCEFSKLCRSNDIVNLQQGDSIALKDDEIWALLEENENAMDN